MTPARHVPMNVTSLLRRLLNRQPAFAEDLDSITFTATTVAGLDVHAALEAHLRLRKRLLVCADGQCDPLLNSDDLCFDDRCPLGRWLHGPARTQLGKHRGFVDLLEQHRMFHIAAANVVALSRAGKLSQPNDQAQAQMEKFSNRVLKRLNAIHDWMDRRAQRHTPPRRAD